MLRLTITSAWSRKRRLIGTTFAIVLGVAFLSATLVLGDSARAGFATVFAEANAGTDAFVRSDQELTGAEEAIRPPIAAGVVEQLAGLDAVAAVSPFVEGRGQVLDAGGDSIGGNGPPTIAAGWIDDPALTGWDIASGRGPSATGEAVVDRASAETAGVELGDTITVLVPDPIEVMVVGITSFGDQDSIGGTTYVGLPMAQAQQVLLGGVDRVSGVIVVAADGVDDRQLVDRISSVLPDGVEAITGDELTREQEEQIEGDFLGFFTAALTAFAVTALVVAAFSIFNTFSILAVQRTRESALLRALGASRRQVLLSALAESTVVGMIGAAIGAGVGVLLALGMLALIESAGFGLPNGGVVVTTGSIVWALVAGTSVTVLSGLVPAWRASRVAPLAALREMAVDHSGSSRVRTVGGVVVSTAGALLVLAGDGGSLTRAGIGALGLVTGVILLGPVVARPVVAVLGAPLRMRGPTGDLARRNAVRSPRRTAATATALLVGVGIVSLFTVFGASLSASIEQQVDRSFAGDLSLLPAGGGFSGAGISPSTIDDVRALPETSAAAGLGYGPATVDGRQEAIDFSDPANLAVVADFDIVAGDLAAMTDAGLAVSADYAEQHGYTVGDRVELGFPDGDTATLTVAAVYEAQLLGGDVLVTDSLWADHASQSAFYLGLVSLADGVDLDTGRAAVESVTAGAGAPDVMDRDEFVESRAAAIDALLTVIYALLGVAILIALMGIANTMTLAVHERTKELGLLRAVGQSRSQSRAMVRWESVVVSTFGAAGGLGIGLFLSWGLVRALNAAEGFGEYAVPVGQLVVVLGVGAVAGFLAGLRPAWRASRLDILAAISDD